MPPVVRTFAPTLIGAVALAAAQIPDGDALTARHVDVAAMRARAAVVERRLVDETDPAQARQYRVLAVALKAQRTHAQPFTGVEVEAVFTAPSGATFRVPGFYDGDGTWKVRFMPYETGAWRWRSSCSVADDPGLHGREGAFTAAPAAGSTPLARHGGHLRVGANRRHLTHTDGTPFFWLGDTWWFVPTMSFPYGSSPHAQCSSMYQLCVQLRERQGYNMLTVGFLGERPDLHIDRTDAAAGFHGKDDLFRVERWNERSLEFWRNADRSLLYADEAGMAMTMNLVWNSDLPRYAKEFPDHDRLLELLWPVHRYTIARLGSFNVIWHVVAEYNHGDVQKAGLVPVTFALAERMRALDPYRDRPMTIFPWPASMAKADDAWKQPWHGFRMFQGGHYKAPWQVEKADVLRTGWQAEPAQPVLITEHNFEGIFDKKNDDGDVRAAAWRSMMCGSCGVTYGGTGLWYPNRDENDRRDWHWGNNAWTNALDYPGARHLGVLRAFFERLPWHDMRPLPRAVTVMPEPNKKKAEHLMPTASAFGADHVVCYIPGGLPVASQVSLQLPEGRWRLAWFDPRSGERRDGDLVAGGAVALPARPDALDWVVHAQRQP